MGSYFPPETVSRSSAVAASTRASASGPSSPRSPFVMTPTPAVVPHQTADVPSRPNLATAHDYHTEPNSNSTTATLSGRTRSKGKGKGKGKAKPRRLLPTLASLRSFLYHTTFWLFLAITATLLVGAAWGLGEQSWRTADSRSWNLVVLAAAYAALGIISIIHVWSRILSIKKILRTMPKPYIPTKSVDVPKKVAQHIAVEYSRTAVVAHISQATTGQQEGWGRPGTKWEDKHFRTYILSTLPVMRQALCPDSTDPPHSMQPLYAASSPENMADQGALRLFVNSYGKIIERARYGRSEPTQEDAEAVEKVVEVVLLTLEVKRRRERKAYGEKTANDTTRQSDKDQSSSDGAGP